MLKKEINERVAVLSVSDNFYSAPMLALQALY